MVENVWIATVLPAFFYFVGVITVSSHLLIFRPNRFCHVAISDLIDILALLLELGLEMVAMSTLLLIPMFFLFRARAKDQPEVKV